MVMPRYMDVELKKDGQVIFETTVSRGCLMMEDEFESVVKDALQEYAAKGHDGNDWTSVAVNGQEMTKEQYMKKTAFNHPPQRKPRNRGPFGM